MATVTKTPTIDEQKTVVAALIDAVDPIAATAGMTVSGGQAWRHDARQRIVLTRCAELGLLSAEMLDRIAAVTERRAAVTANLSAARKHAESLTVAHSAFEGAFIPGADVQLKEVHAYLEASTVDYTQIAGALIAAMNGCDLTHVREFMTGIFKSWVRLRGDLGTTTPDVSALLDAERPDGTPDAAQVELGKRCQQVRQQCRELGFASDLAQICGYVFPRFDVVWTWAVWSRKSSLRWFDPTAVTSAQWSLRAVLDGSEDHYLDKQSFEDVPCEVGSWLALPSPEEMSEATRWGPAPRGRMVEQTMGFEQWAGTAPGLASVIDGIRESARINRWQDPA